MERKKVINESDEVLQAKRDVKVKTLWESAKFEKKKKKKLIWINYGTILRILGRENMYPTRRDSFLMEMMILFSLICVENDSLLLVILTIQQFS